MNTKNNNKEVYKSIKIKIFGIPKEYMRARHLKYKTQYMGDSTGDDGYYQQDLVFPNKKTARKYLAKAKVKVTLPNSDKI